MNISSIFFFQGRLQYKIVAYETLKYDFDLKDFLGTIQEESTHDDQERVYIPTQGIDITKRSIGDAGIFRIWDCAGHVKYHVSHSMFLGAENSIFIVVYNLTKKLHGDDVST